MRLASAITDEDMLREFPDQKLITLQRRRRLLRNQPTISDGVSLGLMGLEETRFNPKNFSAIVVGDLQSPFYDFEALASFNHLLEDFGTVHAPINALINVGDHFDFYAISKYKKSNGRGTPEAFIKEIEIGRAVFEAWRVILGDDVEMILHKGNHEERWDKYLETKDNDHLYAALKHSDNRDALSFESITGLGELGVRVIPYMKPTLYGDTVVVHGTTSTKVAGTVARNMVQGRYGTNVIVGHSHTGAMVTQRYLMGTYVGIENFTLCDLDGLGYAEFPNWCQGFTYMKVVDGVSYLRPVVMRNKSFEFNGHFYTPKGRN